MLSTKLIYTFTEFRGKQILIEGCLLGPDVWSVGGAGADGPGLQLPGAALHGAGQQARHHQAGIGKIFYHSLISFLILYCTLYPLKRQILRLSFDSFQMMYRLS